MKESPLKEYVAANLRSCQLKQLSILVEIDRICEKHGITYWLDGGTLLGAVRHGGFIPWDDDIDIGMPLADMKRFIQIAPSELPSSLFLQTKETDASYKGIITKVRDLNSLYVESHDTFISDYKKGLFIDIFPFIDYPTVPKKWVKKLMKGLSKSYDILHTQHYYSFRSFVEFFYFGSMHTIYKAIWKLLCLIFPKGTYLSNTIHNNGYGIVHRIDSVYPLSEIEFEGRRFKAPGNIDAYLTDLYKNYMEIPPVDKRKIHAIYIHPELIKEP